MSTFSDVLTEYINTKNIKVFPMAKYCGLDRSTMYKLISGKRNPPPRDILKKMILFMHLTPTEAQHLEEANAAAYNWISLELDEDDCQLPPVSDEDDLDLKEGDIVRNISVNIRFYEGWDE